MPKKWYESNTKRGGVLIAIGTIITTIGMVDKGNLGLVEGITLVIAEIGVLLTIFGYRNAIGKKK